MIGNEAIDVPCPRCDQPAGQWCRSTLGHPYRIDTEDGKRNVPALHRQRRKAYELQQQGAVK